MSRKQILVILLAFVAAGAFAQAYTVSYLDGTVQLQTAKGWQALNIGDQVPADATVRLSQSGSLELQRGQATVSILKDGTYSIASLSKAVAQGSTGGGNSLTKKLQTLVTEKPKTGTVGGVRGAEQGTGGPVTWVDESDETRTKVQSLLDQKKYTDALKVLNGALSDSSSTEMDPAELTYLTGVAYYGAGQAARAYKALAKITPDATVDWYARYIILKSQVLVDTLNYDDALAVLNPFVTAYPTGEATQMAYLLTFYSKKGLGDMTAAKAALDAGFKLDPSTDTAKLIDAQRKAQ